MTQKLREILQSVLLNINADGLCNLDECEPARWIESEDGNPTALEEFPEGYYSPLKAV